jgi:DNA-binding winged helix-turn-helix (wHTH) protein/Tfp pilus assembly protein PilF
MAQSGDFATLCSPVNSSEIRKFKRCMVPQSQSNSVVRFGVFEADVRSGELRKNGVRVKIQDLPFRALKLLLSRPNQVLSREELRQALWPEGVFVDFDHGISSAINRLRDALGDSADNPVFIETLDRKGYRWIAPTQVQTPSVPAPASSGPKLVAQPVVTTAAPRTANHSLLTRSWVLIFPVLALVLAVSGFWPVYRAAKVAASRSHTGSKSAASGHASDNSSDNTSGNSSSEAEQFYLKGRFYWNKRTPDGLNKAVDSFTQAIIRDPTYAPAYVGLADCYNLLREYTLMPASEAYPRALAAAKRAVELDDQNSDAHASLAFALFWGNWDLANADSEFRRAIALNPNNSIAHHWYATYLGTVGRGSESLAEIERAQALDPASKAILADKGILLWGAGRQNEAVTLLKQLEASEPDFISPHRYLKEIDLAGADYAAYLAEWKTEASLMHDESTTKLVESAEKYRAGSQGLLRSILALQNKLYEQGSISPYSLAQTEAIFGNKQEALRLLTIAYQKHDENTVGIAADPTLGSLHEEPAYKDLVARLGLHGNQS